MTDDRLLTPGEFARKVRRNKRTVLRWASRPRFPGAVKVDGRLLGFHWPTFVAQAR